MEFILCGDDTFWQRTDIFDAAYAHFSVKSLIIFSMYWEIKCLMTNNKNNFNP